jgi:hypothetical protein
MRSALLLVSLVLALALPGCLGGGSNLEGPTTIGDQGRTVWQISDGLCGDGLFGTECDLNRELVPGASPLVEVRGHGGNSLEGATLTVGPGLTLTGASSSTDDHGTLLRAHVGAETAGFGDLIVLDRSGHEIDRAHLTFFDPTRIVCGELATSVTRDLSFAGLVSNRTVEVTTAAGSTSTSTTLACRAEDSSGRAMLTVDAIRWTIADGAEGTISVHSDDLLGSAPAFGATARIVTVGAGHATVHATLGATAADIPVTFR